MGVLFVIVGIASGSAWSAVSAGIGKILLVAGLIIVAAAVYGRPHRGED